MTLTPSLPFGALFFTTPLLVMAILTSPVTRAEQPPGWKWYNDPLLIKEKALTPPPPTPSVTVTRTLSPTQQMQWFHRYHDDTKNDALINKDDVKKAEKLMLLNQFAYNMSSDFGMTFQKALLMNPDLSYTKDRPTEQAARSTYLQMEREKKIRAVRQLAGSGWGLFFVYEGASPMAEKLAPSVQQFADAHGIEVLGISLDGTQLASIHQNRDNSNHIQVPFSPALVLVNPNTQEMKPLAYGFIAQEDLLGRFLNVATDFAPDF
ncbi:type-F conjugative transfer system pilin assembly protein TraF [Photobacterium profundum]|uniref:Hypothetical sex pilus assembly and synthesis protein (TraF) [Photobacterium profundum SS9] n=1 Tax=Photobacterium profundum (strain SS9) TaxID=298386 RepID=Q6LW83_PHOPR|nr:type-F conjugative transfer system pilin assembly protein TraF [Photobacterium profundum]CAG17952.1 hypothetical sex pilus assembly and synthesis protein (TraF) [Photobacterium profundum SS9]